MAFLETLTKGMKVFNLNGFFSGRGVLALSAIFC